MTYNDVPYRQRYGGSSGGSAGSGGTGGAISRGQVDVDFGYPGGGEDGLITQFVNALWVTATSRVICTPAADGTADHLASEAALEGVTFRATDIMPGIGFNITAFAVNDTWGRYRVDIRG